LTKLSNQPLFQQPRDWRHHSNISSKPL